MSDPMMTAARGAMSDSGGVLEEAVAAALQVMAEEIDRGPTFPLPPSVISELVRERAAGLAPLDSTP
jgi:hypothetical protein